ncbi:MAG: hypothetical protein COB78_12740 [Hyphomicrobiales bacterium]|nr:MAG: hypothetical protein COB78_12740 [Hyphomicrobiales bacterium]
MVKPYGRNYVSGMEHNLKQKIGLRVKAARAQKGMTQPQLAEVINKAFETVSNIERGKTAPNFQTLLDISVALGVPMRNFFDGVENSEPENKRQELVIQSQVLAGQMDELTLALWQKLGEVLLEEQSKE